MVYDPSRDGVLAVGPCEDGYTQEHAVLADVLQCVSPGELWFGDRNFCVRAFLLGLRARGAFFIIREQAQFRVRPRGPMHEVGAAPHSPLREVNHTRRRPVILWDGHWLLAPSRLITSATMRSHASWSSARLTVQFDAGLERARAVLPGPVNDARHQKGTGIISHLDPEFDNGASSHRLVRANP